MFTIPNNNSWSCLPASFAMACGIPFRDFIDLLGHNGDARPYKDKSKRRGFHFQECIEVVWNLGFACTPIERFPALIHSYGDTEATPIYFGQSDADNLARFMRYLTTAKQGVLEGIRKRIDGSNAGHAVAWDGELIYDPSGKTYLFEDGLKNNLYIHTLWILTGGCHGKTKVLDI
jgi:hypothetical protein